MTNHKNTDNMKAILVEFSFMARLIIDENEENIESIISKARPKMLEKVKNELGENLVQWNNDIECPYIKGID